MSALSSECVLIFCFCSGSTVSQVSESVSTADEVTVSNLPSYPDSNLSADVPAVVCPTKLINLSCLRLLTFAA